MLQKNMNTLTRAKILTLVAKIPPGRLMTYASLARAAGMPKAIRYMGTILGSNKLLITIPCHRVVRSDGSLGGYAGGLKKKEGLLRAENITIKNNRVIALSTYLVIL